MWSNQKFVEALMFAAKAHRNQNMFYPEDMPYTVHICSVMQFAIRGCLQDATKDFDWDLLVQCALLHDVIEDTNVTFEMIEKKFGLRVANGVFALSKDKKLDKSLQMKDSISRIKKQPTEIAVVKLADRLFNLHIKVPTWSPEKQESYKKEAQLICDELGYASETLRSQLQKAIDEYLYA